MLIAAVLGSLIIGITNFINGWAFEATILMAFTIISLVGLFLNGTHFSEYVGLALCISLFVVIVLMLYNGLGLYDETLLAFPLFLVFISFLFGRKGLGVATILSAGAVIAFFSTGLWDIRKRLCELAHPCFYHFISLDYYSSGHLGCA